MDEYGKSASPAIDLKSRVSRLKDNPLLPKIGKTKSGAIQGQEKISLTEKLMMKTPESPSTNPIPPSGDFGERNVLSKAELLLSDSRVSRTRVPIGYNISASNVKHLSRLQKDNGIFVGSDYSKENTPYVNCTPYGDKHLLTKKTVKKKTDCRSLSPIS